MSCRFCNDPGAHTICAACLMKQFASPYTSDYVRLEAWRKRRDEREQKRGPHA